MKKDSRVSLRIPSQYEALIKQSGYTMQQFFDEQVNRFINSACKKTKKIEKPKQVKRSPLADLFLGDNDIIDWLNGGNIAAQARLLNDYPAHVLTTEIAKAFRWQLANRKRKSDAFLVNWLNRSSSNKTGFEERGLTYGMTEQEKALLAKLGDI